MASYNWTTADEILFLRDLYAAGKASSLRKYAMQCTQREWSGRGMAVDVHVVVERANALADELESVALTARLHSRGVVA